MNKIKYFWLVLISIITSPLFLIPMANVIAWLALSVLMMSLGNDIYEKLTNKEGTSMFYKSVVALIITVIATLIVIFLPYKVITILGFDKIY